MYNSKDWLSVLLSPRQKSSLIVRHSYCCNGHKTTNHSSCYLFANETVIQKKYKENKILARLSNFLVRSFYGAFSIYLQRPQDVLIFFHHCLCRAQFYWLLPGEYLRKCYHLELYSFGKSKKNRISYLKTSWTRWHISRKGFAYFVRRLHRISC